MISKIVYNFVLVLALILSATNGTIAQQGERGSEISAEIDPVTFGFNGYGVHLRVKPANSNHLLLGIGTYAMDMPKALVDFNKTNKGKGWNVRLNQGYGLFAEHHFTEVNNKWFVGGQISYQQYKIENENIKGIEKFSNILIMTYTGYTWHPFNYNFYIKPWAGIGYMSKISGENILGNSEYDISPITMFATFHIGYTF